MIFFGFGEVEISVTIKIRSTNRLNISLFDLFIISENGYTSKIIISHKKNSLKIFFQKIILFLFFKNQIIPLIIRHFNQKY